MMKKLFFLSALLFFLASGFSQSNNIDSGGMNVRTQILSAETSSWTSVISGKALCEPKRTSYGFVVLTDGKMISACTESGTKLWERGIPGHPEPFLSVFSSDFVLSVSDKKNLSLINPSGLTLWTVKVPFAITENPASGRDSRIFVKGKKEVACYGVNGILKWNLEFPALKNIPLLEMNDGSLLVFMESLSGGKTCGVRISPFGETVENISFSGQVISASSCDDGILLAFTGGGCGMCAVKDGSTVTKWTIPYSDRAFSNTNCSSGVIFRQFSNHLGILLTECTRNCTRAMVFSTMDGRVSDWFDIEITFKNISCVNTVPESDGIFVSDSKNAYIHARNGDVLWKAFLPAKDIFSKWNFITYTRGNYLVICSTSWAMAAFRTSYKISKKNNLPQKQKKGYPEYISKDNSFLSYMQFSDKIDTKITGTNRAEILLKGKYAVKEEEYISSLTGLLNDYSDTLSSWSSRGTRTEMSIYQKDRTGMQEVLLQLPLYGTDTFIPLISKLVKNEKDEFNLQILLKGIAQNGFDPEGYILSALEQKAKTLQTSKTTEFYLLCDAVYEICRFMGRPALYSKGMQILTALLYPQYDSSVRDYARNTLTKIAVLKI